MFLPIRPALICIWSLLLMSGTSAQTAQPSSAVAQGDAAALTVTDNDSGKDIDLTTGQTLIVKLKGNPSTGYGWSVSGDPAPLHLKKSYPERSKSGMAGAPQTTVFQFSAASAGVANLSLVYRRPWEHNTAPARTFTVRVNVR